MNEFTVWMQNNWYELGTLVSEFVFLAAGIWFARKVLKTMRASQEQVGALLKLSVTGPVMERQSPGAIAERPPANASPYWLTPSEAPVSEARKLGETGPSQLVSARHGLIGWLQEPMSRGEVTPLRKAIRWLQSPASH